MESSPESQQEHKIVLLSRNDLPDSDKTSREPPTASSTPINRASTSWLSPNSEKTLRDPPITSSTQINRTSTSWLSPTSSDRPEAESPILPKTTEPFKITPASSNIPTLPVRPPMPRIIGRGAHSIHSMEIDRDACAPEVSPREYGSDKVFLHMQLYQPPVYEDNQAEREPLQGHDIPQPLLSETEKQKDPSRTFNLKTRRILLFALVPLLILITGAVVGGILGSASMRRNKSTETTDPSSSPTARPSAIPSATTSDATETGTKTGSPGMGAPMPTESTAPCTMLKNSRLAVTGWRSNDIDFTINLFYQDTNGLLRYSNFSRYLKSWSGSFVTEDSDMMAGTSIAAGAYLQRDTAPEAEIFYFDERLKIHEQRFPSNGSNPVESNQGSDGLGLLNGSRIAVYWPYVVVQDSIGALHLVSKFLVNESSEWQISTTLVGDASFGTGLAVVPLKPAYQENDLTSVLLYRTTKGTLGGAKLAVSNGNIGNMDWAGNAPMDLPKTTAIAASAMNTAEGKDGENSWVILYQDASNIIQFVTYVPHSNFTSPRTSGALSGADAGTDIACLTEAAYANVSEISEKTDMCRCYFMSDGMIKEVIYDGDSWSEIGIVPIS